MGHKPHTPLTTYMPAPNLDNFFAADASRILEDVTNVQRVEGRVSALMRKDVLPDGNGWVYQAVQAQRSIPNGGSGWTPVVQPDGSGNNCNPEPAILNPATLIQSYGLEQKRTKSNYICLTDARRAYDWTSQVKYIRDNFVAQVVDDWEDKDTDAFIAASKHKMIFAQGLPESGTVFPGVAATSQLTQSLLDQVYSQLILDGAGRDPYATANAKPLLSLLISDEASRGIIKGDASIREDFRFAQMGKDNGSALLQSWNVDRYFGGFMHLINMRTPRYNFVGGDYVRVPFYENQSTSIGDSAEVSAAYKNAEFEVAIVWHPKVVKRQVPDIRTTVGADTSFRPVNLNGDVQWLNIPNETTNIAGDTGFWLSTMAAAYRPEYTRYGYVIMFKRCPNVEQNPCPDYN